MGVAGFHRPRMGLQHATRVGLAMGGLWGYIENIGENGVFSKWKIWSSDTPGQGGGLCGLRVVQLNRPTRGTHGYVQMSHPPPNMCGRGHCNQVWFALC